LLATVPISSYDQSVALPFADVDADGEASQIKETLSPLGTRLLTDLPPAVRRDANWVQQYLSGWAGRREPASSMLVWVGHGESDGESAWLALHASERNRPSSGRSPDSLAVAVREEWQLRRSTPGAWAIVVVEACGAERFVELVDSQISHMTNAPARLALIGAGGLGTAFLGTFRKALAAAVGSYTSNDHHISVRDLVSAIEDRLHASNGEQQVVITRKLGDATPILRTREFADDITAPVDIYRELRGVLQGLPPDQQSHFIPKAQGAEQGELAWFFEGRAAERRQIHHWLSQNQSGMLVVTGRAGSGKSALLGNLIVHATAELRDLLIHTKQLSRLPSDQAPGDQVFDDMILLTGQSTSELATRLSSAAGLGEPPPGLELSERIDWLLDALRERQAPFTLLVDGLDEAQDPFAIAGSILGRLSSLPRCRILIGTRRSTHEGPDLPDPDDENILDALGGRSQLSVVTVKQDPDAVRTYITRRLTSARLDQVTAPRVAIQTVAENIAGRQREFLYARLAVHELLRTPALFVDPQRSDDLARLLDRDHRALFQHAVERLRDENPVHKPLLEALAFSQGRGLPRGDRIWVTVANALAENLPTITEDDIDHAVEEAAPYIMIDGDAGQSVYRLAHRTFQEFFLSTRETATPTPADRRSGRASRVFVALLDLASTTPGVLNAYFRQYLPRHIRSTEDWRALAGRPAVLERLDAGTLAAEITRSLFGRSVLPAELKVALVAAPQLTGTTDLDARQLIRALTRRRLLIEATADDARIAWTDLTPTIPHVPMDQQSVRTHRSELDRTEAMVFGFLAKRLVLVTCTSSTIRVWDPIDGTELREPIKTYPRFINSIALGELPGRGTVIVDAADDGSVGLWDPETGTMLHDPVQAHHESVNAVAFGWLHDGSPLVATGGRDGQIAFIDPMSGGLLRPPILGHEGGVEALCFGELSAEVVLATAGKDRVIRLWDGSGTALGSVLPGSRVIGFSSLAAATADTGDLVLASCEPYHGVEVYWFHDKSLLKIKAFSLDVPVGGHGAVAFGRLEGSLVMATGDDDHSVRLWDPESGDPRGHALTGHTGGVQTVAFGATLDGRVLLASGGDDRLVRIWDPTSTSEESHPRKPSIFGAICLVSAHGEQGVAVDGPDKTIELRALTTGLLLGESLVGHDYDPSAICAMPKADASNNLLLASGDFHSLHLWNTAAQIVASASVGPIDRIECIAATWLPTRGLLVAAGDKVGRLYLWRPFARWGRKLITVQHRWHILGVAFGTPQVGETLLAYSVGDSIVISRAVRPRMPRLIISDEDLVFKRLEFVTLPAGRVVLVSSCSRLSLESGASFMYSIRIFDPVGGDEVLPPIPEQPHEIVDLAAVVTGRARLVIVTVSDNAQVDAWEFNAGSWASLLSMNVLPSRPFSLVCSGTTVVLSCHDGVIALDLPELTN
jgi:WD40 repeat protein